MTEETENTEFWLKEAKITSSQATGELGVLTVYIIHLRSIYKLETI